MTLKVIDIKKGMLIPRKSATVGVKIAMFVQASRDD